MSSGLRDWDIYHVLAWLDGIRMSRYDECFASNHINGFCLLRLEHSLLKEMNVAKVGDRIRLLSEIRRLQNGYIPEITPDKIKDAKRNWAKHRQSSKESLNSLDRSRVVLKIIVDGNKAIQVGVSDQMSYKEIIGKVFLKAGIYVNEGNLNLYNLVVSGNDNAKFLTEPDLLAIVRDQRPEKDKLILRKRHVQTQKSKSMRKLENLLGEDFDGKLPSADPNKSAKLNKFFGERPPSDFIGQNLKDYFPRESIVELRRISKVPELPNIMPESSLGSSLRTSENSSNKASPRRSKSDRKPDLKINTAATDHSGSLPDSPTTLESAGPIKFIKGNLIGKGSFGSVYMGMNAVNGEILAVKMVEMPKEDGPDVELKKKLYRALQKEIGILKQLNHTHIVRYLGSQIQDDHLNIFLEYVAGGSVQGLLEEYGSFEEQLVQKFIRQSLLGLEYLHNQGIIHRDIKSGNILVDNRGDVKITDFGISTKLKGEDQTLSMAGNRMSLKGSVYWMAPEVVKYMRYTDKGDIWSLACLMIEMISGEHPWPGLGQLEAIYKIGNFEVPPFPAELTPFAKSFLDKALVVQHDNRPSATQLIQHPFCK